MAQGLRPVTLLPLPPLPGTATQPCIFVVVTRDACRLWTSQPINLHCSNDLAPISTINGKNFVVQTFPGKVPYHLKPSQGGLPRNLKYASIIKRPNPMTKCSHRLPARNSKVRGTCKRSPHYPHSTHQRHQIKPAGRTLIVQVVTQMDQTPSPKING